MSRKRSLSSPAGTPHADGRKEDKTFEEAIRSAFQAISIELRKYRDKRAKTEVRLPPVPPHRGVICKLFPKERYGFILKEGGGEVYFHANALAGAHVQETRGRY